MATTPKRRKAERWQLVQTITATTPMDYTETSTPFFDSYKQALTRANDALLYVASGTVIKLRTQEDIQAKNGATNLARVRLFIYHLVK